MAFFGAFTFFIKTTSMRFYYMAIKSISIYLYQCEAIITSHFYSMPLEEQASEELKLKIMRYPLPAFLLMIRV
jgi:hypothetical protein